MCSELNAASASVDLYWLPLGAGDNTGCVRVNGRVFEALVARREHRAPRALFHAALEVRLGAERYTVEMAPAWSAPPPGRGVVCEGPVGLSWLGRSRLFRYQVRCSPGGSIPDAAEAVDSPRRLSTDPARARRVLTAAPAFPVATWGRDELRAGEMWNSNSLVAWLLARSGHHPETIAPPRGGRAPGWTAGLVVAAREPQEPSHPSARCHRTDAGVPVARTGGRMDQHPLIGAGRAALAALVRAAAAAGGAVLAGGTHTLAALRPAPKPLHPAGDVRRGRIDRTGGPAGKAEPTGVGWLDEPGRDEVQVRLSRAIGLPRRLPDIHGLAVRVPDGTGHGDLLFASTGWGRVTRFLLTGSRSARRRPLTTLLPYDTDTGPVLLAAHGTTPETYELCWARPSGPWHRFGVLRLAAGGADTDTETGGDRPISFDPVRHQIAGLRQYAAVRRLREPAYLRARASRAKPRTPTTEESPRVH